MTVKLPSLKTPTGEKIDLNKFMHSMWRQRWMYFLMTLTIIYFLIFKYIPLWNAQIAFKDFKPLLGVMGSPWVGFKHFESFINSFYFTELITNTVFFSLAKLLLGLPIAVICAIALHETLLVRFRTFVQTVIYLPHCLSWVIMCGVLLVILSPGDGLLNTIIEYFGGKPIEIGHVRLRRRAIEIGHPMRLYLEPSSAEDPDGAAGRHPPHPESISGCFPARNRRSEYG